MWQSFWRVFLVAAAGVLLNERHELILRKAICLNMHSGNVTLITISVYRSLTRLKYQTKTAANDHQRFSVVTH